MKRDDEDKLDHQDEEEQGGEGRGGIGGKIHFRFKDAASLGPRDDMLPPSEIKRLLIIHKDIHKERVNKQKLTREERAALKEGKLNRAGQYGMGEGVSNYKRHPLSSKAQFSGIDRQTIGIPTEYNANTNAELAEKLENRFTLRNAPKFNPKPRPR